MWNVLWEGARRSPEKERRSRLGIWTPDVRVELVLGLG
jgi:hypothetical protein